MVGHVRIFGKDPNHLEEEGSRVCRLLEEAQIKYHFTKRHLEEIWQKYIFIAAYGLVTASENKTLGEVYEDYVSSKKVLGIMQEIVKIGQAEGIDLNKEMIDIAFHKAAHFPYEARTSFQRDYEEGRLDERELFGNTMITLAEKHRIDIPFIINTYHLINY